MTFKDDFYKAVTERLSGKTIKADTDMGKFAVAVVDALKVKLLPVYPNAEFKIEQEGTEFLVYGDESPAQGDGHIIEFNIGARNALVFISFQEG